MAYCANCGREMSDAATACPNCGHPNEALVRRTSYAGFWIRFLGALIDGVIIGVGTALFDTRAGTVVWFLYTWLMLALNDGRTVGKMAVGIRVARPDGSSVTLGQAAGRQAMAIVSGIPLALGFLWAAWDSENRTWHDMVADTRVFPVR